MCIPHASFGCGDIESAHFAKLIVHDFWEDTNKLPTLLEGIEGLMETYKIPVATAAGLYKLLKFDFNWFKSAHDIHYFLGKISTINKEALEMISRKLAQGVLPYSACSVYNNCCFTHKSTPNFDIIMITQFEIYVNITLYFSQKT